MIIRDFFAWTTTAPAEARARGASVLARTYLCSALSVQDRAEASRALTCLLDDPSPLVRLAMASVFAGAAHAPHHVVTALANDRPDIAALVLRLSPLLTEAELVDAVAVGDAPAQIAVAQRAGLPVGIAAALAEVGTLHACLALCDNPSADIAPSSLARMVARFGHDADLRDTLLARPDLDPVLRHDLVVATAQALTAFATHCAWIPAERAQRIAREATEQACVAIAAECARDEGKDGASRLVAHLRAAGRLTPALMLRAVLCGNFHLFDAAVSNLSGVPMARVAGLARGRQGLGFEALYRKAGLPIALLPAFRAAVNDGAGHDVEGRESGSTLQRQRIERVIAACDGLDSATLGKVTALLRRFDAEAAREDARVFALDLGRERRVGMAQHAPLLPAETVPYNLRPAA